MFWHRYNGPPRGSRGAAFTLIEIVVALTIVAVIAAVAIPTLKGLGREERARAPMEALAGLVQEIRQRAIKERRPYQIVFERSGVHGLADGFPTRTREEFLKALDEARTPPPNQVIERAEVIKVGEESEETEQEQEKEWPKPIGLAAPPEPEPPTTPAEVTGVAEAPGPARWEPPWTVTIALPEKSECELLFWGDAEWDRLEGDEIRRWVFQPSGIANPVRVLLRTEAVELEAAFDALTGEVVRERIDFLPAQP